MNLFQAANGAATFLILSQIVAGLAQYFNASTEEPVDLLMSRPEVLLLGLFLVLFRIKTLLDDHKHFAEIYQDKAASRYIGFMLAVVSWIFWGIAAFQLSSTIRSSQMMAVSILVSTLWLVVHIIEILMDKARRKTELLTSVMREKWVFVNVIYILLLVAHMGWFAPAIPAGAKTPLLLLLAVLAIDVVTSRSLRDVGKPGPAG